MNKYFIFFVLLVSMVLCADQPTKHISIDVPGLGSLLGNQFDDHLDFRNIPYIKPPVGSLRWKNPVPISPWSHVLNATTYGPGCPQSCYLPKSACPTVISEDCVQLNIFTPVNISKKVPVMVFFPGGDFQQGTAGFPLYDGRFFVKRGDVVVVTANYRLGPLGFIATKNTLTGNYGLLDQIEALKFVKKFISHFGGDPNSVTIFGQSAGAASVATHLVSPLSKGLFHKAVIQSDPFTLPFKTHKTAISEGELFLKNTKCSDNYECLQKLDLKTITSAEVVINKHLDLRAPLNTFLPWAPIVGSDLLSDHPISLIQRGEYNKVPVMLGTVENECLPFIYKADKNEINDAEYIAVVEYIFGINAGSQLLTRYPPKPVIGDKRPQLSALGTTYVFSCSTRNVSLNLAKHSNEGVYMYLYDHSASFDLWGPDYKECVGHVCHAAELLLEWGTPPLVGYKYTPEEQALSNLMIDYWTNFAKSGSPNIGNQVPTWPQFDSAGLLNMKFQTPQSYVESNYKTSDCDFFDYYGYHFGW